MTNTDERPQHRPGCLGLQEFGPCEGCQWMHARQLEFLALHRFCRLFRLVPSDAWQRTGFG